MLIFVEHYWNIYPKLNIGQQSNVYLKLFSSTWQEVDLVWEILAVENIHTDILKENNIHRLNVILSCKYRKLGKMENIKMNAKRQTDQRSQTAEEKQGSWGRQGGMFERCSYSRGRKASQGLRPAAEALRRR